MPIFSVIIPTYNRQKYVIKAIDSVLAQTLNDCEIIVIDDGSSDNTRAVLGPYKQKLLYIYQENKGVSEARNAGIREAKGEWISFLDSDDEWRKDYLLTQMNHITLYPDAVAHITNSAYIFIDGTNGSNHFDHNEIMELFDDRSVELLERPFSFIVDHSHWFLQSTVIRREVLLQTGLLNPRLSIVEDMDLIARIALKGPISFCRDKLVEIHTREESIENLSSQWIKKGIFSRQIFGEVYTNFLKLPGLNFRDKMTVARVLSVNWRALGNVLIKDNRKIEGRQYYRESLLLYPSVQSLIKYLASFLPQHLSVLLVRKGSDIVPR